MTGKEIFVITPIGKKGTANHAKFDAIVKTMIEPAAKSVNPEFIVKRADQVAKPGSFVKDILQNLRNSFIVIANLTDLNPNVFYELGVRHTLSNRTIIITEELSSLPSDLREYRAIEYRADITGVEDCTKNLSNAIKEIIKDPDHPDNPVQDRIGSIITSREKEYVKEIETLKKQLVGTRAQRSSGPPPKETVNKRVERILQLWNVEEGDEPYQEWNDYDEKGKIVEYKIPEPEGNFEYYFLEDDKKEEYCLVISVHNSEFDLFTDLADVRVMLSKYAKIGSARFTFVIATDLDLVKERSKLRKFLQKALVLTKVQDKKRFKLELWNSRQLHAIEKKLGLRI